MTLAASFLVALVGSASGQHFQIEFGKSHHGGRHHHHHCYDWRPSFGYYGYFAPPPVTYVYPAPVRREVTYVYPSPSEPLAAQPPAAPASEWTNRVEARPNALPAAQTSTVVVENPVGSGAPVAFIVDQNSEVSLRPGESRSLSGNSSYLVEFDRGGNFGVGRRTLGQGTFDFVATDRGWDLVSRASLPTQTAVKPSLKRNELPAATLR